MLEGYLHWCVYHLIYNLYLSSVTTCCMLNHVVKLHWAREELSEEHTSNHFVKPANMFLWHVLWIWTGMEDVQTISTKKKRRKIGHIWKNKKCNSSCYVQLSRCNQLDHSVRRGRRHRIYKSLNAYYTWPHQLQLFLKQMIKLNMRVLGKVLNDHNMCTVAACFGKLEASLPFAKLAILVEICPTDDLLIYKM